MSDSTAAKTPWLGAPENEESMISDTWHSVGSSGLRWNYGLHGWTESLRHGQIPWALQLLAYLLLVGLLVTTLAQVSNIPSSKDQEKTYQELIQLKTEVRDNLCQLCPRDWTFFHKNCYFFSKSQRNWHDSLTACQDVGAQLVTIETDEEQTFLQQTSKARGKTWMGLSDLNKEAAWLWVDGSPLASSFKQYWNQGEPNNIGDEDCAEFSGNGWNDAPCDNKAFWVCKKASTSSCTIK